MPKRFTATEKWDDVWYRRLPPAYKLLWEFIIHKCDNAGIWEKDLEWAQAYTGLPVTEPESLSYFKDRIKVLDDRYWLVQKFIAFQYGTLYEDCAPHRQVAALAAKHGIVISLLKCKGRGRVGVGYPKGRATLKDKDKDKDKDIDKDKEIGGLGERFRPPTPAEVTDHALTLGSKLDGERFVAYYESNGWRVGKNPMKNWKAAVVTWVKKEREDKGYGTDDRKSTVSFADQFRRNRQTRGVSGLRKVSESAVGSVLDGIRGMSVDGENSTDDESQ